MLIRSINWLLEKLAEIVYHDNQAHRAAEDCGPNLNAITLTVWEDGRASIGVRSSTIIGVGDVVDVFNFRTAEELTNYINNDLGDVPLPVDNDHLQGIATRWSYAVSASSISAACDIRVLLETIDQRDGIIDDLLHDKNVITDRVIPSQEARKENAELKDCNEELEQLAIDLAAEVDTLLNIVTAENWPGHHACARRVLDRANMILGLTNEEDGIPF